MTRMEPAVTPAGYPRRPPLLVKRPGPEGLLAEIAPEDGSQEKDSPDRRFICVFCGETIASPRDMIEVNGAGIHDFANPDGVVFRIRCFSRAEGCFPSGVPTEAHTWFPGFSWRYAHCRGCGAQMGWRYESSSSGFYGLILRNLAEGGA